MIRTIALSLTIFIVSLFSWPLATFAQAGTGVVEGQLVNGTQGGSSVEGQEVTLRTYVQGTETGSTTATTDADGKFKFDGLATESDYGYSASVNFQQVDYYSSWISFGEGESSKAITIDVYDSTTSDEALTITISQMVVYVQGGRLQVMEYSVFSNSGDKSYRGSTEVAGTGKYETLRFWLPTDATELEYATGLMECCTFPSANGLVDTMAVLPGTSEKAFVYAIYPKGTTYDFSRAIYYSTNTFDLLVHGEGIDVSSEQLTTQQPLNIEGQQFTYFTAQNLTPGTTITISVSGLTHSNIQGVIKWLGIGLTVVVAGFGLGYLAIRKRLHPTGRRVAVSKDTLGRKQILLRDIAQLDDDFEAGKIAEDVYQRMRTEKKADLIELMRRIGRED